MSPGGGVSLVLSLAILGYVVWGQLRRRAVSMRLTLPVVLIVLGAGAMTAHASAHPLGLRAEAILAASLVFDAVGLAGVRAYSMRLWVEGGRVWRQGSWVTAALWVAGAAVHVALEAAAGTGGAADLLYLGVTLLAQRLVLQARARRQRALSL